MFHLQVDFIETPFGFQNDRWVSMIHKQLPWTYTQELTFQNDNGSSPPETQLVYCFVSSKFTYYSKYQVKSIE